jgi:23S rRNA pseudouridine2605 synthase
MAIERLQKILAHAGVASRRAAEDMIREGRVRVNGRIVRELGSRADAYKDRVELDGKRLVSEHPVYYLLHKPREVVTTLSDPEQRESVKDLMHRIPERVFPVGRLDYHTSGALLMTNDGEMAQALLHPKKEVPKVYVAKVRGKVSNAHLQQLRLGVTLDDGHKTRPAEVFIAHEDASNMWLQITITEGKNRQVHRMLEAVGHRVNRLFRLSFAGLSADGLRTGEFRMLTDPELAKLKRDYLNPSKKDKAEVQRAARRERAGYGPGEVSKPAAVRSAPRPVRLREVAEARKAIALRNAERKKSPSRMQGEPLETAKRNQTMGVRGAKTKRLGERRNVRRDDAVLDTHPRGPRKKLAETEEASGALRRRGTRTRALGAKTSAVARKRTRRHRDRDSS